MSEERSTFPNEQEHHHLLAALRESEILRELAALLASSLDINYILGILVKRTTEVCGIERCAVWLLDDTLHVLRPATYHLAPQHINSKKVEAADHIWYRTPLPPDDPMIHRLLEEKGMFVLEDLRAAPSMRSIAETFLVRSVLLIALVREGRVLGMMSLDDPDRTRTFTQEQQQLAMAIGQQAAIAIDNAGLYQQAQMERMRAEQLIERAQAVNQVALAVNAGEDLSSILEIAIHHLVRGLRANNGAIVLVDTDTTDATERYTLRLASIATARQDKEASPTSVPTTPRFLREISATLADLPHCHKAAISGIPLFVTIEQAEESEVLWYRELGLDSAMIVPLMVGASRGARIETQASSNGARCVGLAFVNYQNTNYRPSKGQYAFALDMAAQCALAIDKAHILAEARQAARLATERANTLDGIFHAMTEGISVLNMEGQVVLRNNAAAHFLGASDYTKDHLAQILRRHPAYTPHGQHISVEDFPVTRALRGERIRGERILVKRADGFERVIETNIAPMLEETKQQVGVVCAFRDITEQVRVEQRIHQALETMLHVAVAVSGMTEIKDILRSVLEMTLTTLNCDRGAVYLYDEEQKLFTPLLSLGFPTEVEEWWLTEQNQQLPREAFHSSPEEKSLGDRFETQLMDGHATIMNAEDYPELLTPFKQTTLLAAPISNNNRLLGLMVLDCAPITLPGQETTSATWSQRDFTLWDMAVTEGIAQLAGLAMEQARWQQEATNARTSEAAMREANAAKDEFLAITAHEFRTPLTIILTNCQMALRALKRKTNQLSEQDSVLTEALQRLEEHLSNIEGQANQLTNIVNTFLEVSQINQRQLQLKLASLDLAEIVQQVVTSYSKTSAEHHIRCIIDHQPTFVLCDKARIEQVITNLVQNAIKYSPLGGPITVQVHQCVNAEGKPIVEVCVQDTGIGIPKDAQPHLFERFYRAPNTLGTKTRGIGLGLYVVAELLRMHSGTIFVKSSGIPGQGSKFVFTLPAIGRETSESV